MDVEVVKRRGPKSGAAVRPQREEKVVSVIGDPPRELGAFGKKMWRHLAKEAKWLAATDEPALLLLCLSYENHYQLQSRYTEYMKNNEGVTPIAVTLLKELSAASVGLQRQMTGLGLTPKSRKEQGLAEVKLRSKMDEFMAKQHDAQQQKRYARPGGNVAAKKAKRERESA